MSLNNSSRNVCYLETDWIDCGLLAGNEQAVESVTVGVAKFALACSLTA